MDYKDLLKRAREKVSEVSIESGRFEIPKPQVSISGNFTTIKNFYEISTTLRRPKEHLLKFFQRELAVPGSLDKGKGVFQGKFDEKYIQDKLKKYVKEFVLCPTCDKPDTRLIKEERISKIECEACGNKHGVRTLK